MHLESLAPVRFIASVDGVDRAYMFAPPLPNGSCFDFLLPPVAGHTFKLTMESPQAFKLFDYKIANLGTGPDFREIWSVRPSMLSIPDKKQL